MSPRCRPALILSCVLFCAAPIHAEEVRITLLDGSVIVGEIQSLKDGVYMVQSGSLGNTAVKTSSIRRIEMTADSAARAGTSKQSPDRPERAPDAGASDMQAAPARQEIQGIQRQIAENEALMGAVMGLQDDPEVQAILADPQIMEAVRSGDIGAMVNNPKLRGLLDNPTVQDLTKRLAP